MFFAQEKDVFKLEYETSQTECIHSVNFFLQRNMRAPMPCIQCSKVVTMLLLYSFYIDSFFNILQVCVKIVQKKIIT